jgi:hypothetical protein
MDYVSCSPLRILSVRLAAQAGAREKMKVEGAGTK